MSYSTTAPTNQSVIVTLTTDEPIQTPNGWTAAEDKDGKEFTKEYQANTAFGGELVTIKDLARKYKSSSSRYSKYK